MQVHDFFERLTGRYPNYTEYEVNDIQEWIEEQNMSDSQIGELYKHITRNFKFKKFPSLAEIIEIWENNKTPTVKGSKIRSILEHNRRVIASWDVWSTERILTAIQTIRNKSELDLLDREFINKWSELRNEYDTMLRIKCHTSTIVDHLEYVRIQLIKNEPFIRFQDKVDFAQKKQLEQLALDVNKSVKVRC